MADFQNLIKLVEKEQEMKYGAGVCIYCPETGRILLQKRGPKVEDPGQHDWFGGGSDPGEDIRTTAVRELAEEGGIFAEAESLYPLARFGYHPQEGLGGYHIWLLVVESEFPAIPSWDGDTQDEVEDFDWVGPRNLDDIELHERVSSLLSHPRFEQVMKDAVENRYETGHVAKLKQG